ncbi:retrovirus-related pol polyprotein from transposon TNT 1-94 [Tanacetum coccineum]
MSKQCTKPKRKRDDSWFKDKVLLVQAQANGQILHEEELAFLADPGTAEGQATQTVITHNAAYQADDLDAYDSDWMKINTAKLIFMVIPSSEQSNVVNYSETEITSDSNIIPYSQYVKESQQAAVQNSSSSAQQDALILSVIEQLKTQVINCTKINLDNKSVNDTLTAELERYKEQVKVLKEGQNVDLKSKDNVSDSCEQSVEIDRLKQTLSEHVKEKESLMQTVTLLKNDFKKEESRNIDREIALEKKIKQLDNIVFKRDQSAQTIHMLTKPQFFYDHTTKQALGFQNPFYLKKAQQLEPKLYDGNVIKNTSAIVIPDSEETLVLAEESHSKMLLKQQDPMMLEKKVNTTPVDYVALNQLSQDFETRFVPQTILSTKQAFWSQNSMNCSDPTPSCRPTKVEVPTELLIVSMVNTSLKKLKHHLAGFDVVIKERTTATTITEGSWGFEHTKACFRDEIIPFVKALMDLFNTFDQYLIGELYEVQNVFQQMEHAVEQHRLESKMFEVKMNQVLNENEQLLELVINKDIVNIIMNSFVDNTYVNVHECEKCLKLETKLLNKKDFIEKETYDKLFRSFTTLEKHCISLEVDTQLNQEIFQRDHSVSYQCAITFEKDVVITALKNELRKLKGNDLADNVVTKHPIALEMLKIDVEPIAHRLLNNRTAHSDYLRHTQEQAAILREIRPTGRTFTIVGNECPLTRITTTTEVPLRKPIDLESDILKPVVTLVYSRKPRKSKTNVIQIVLWYLDSVKFGNDHVAKILGYGDYQIGNVTISSVYYVEELEHNLFSIGQFCRSLVSSAVYYEVAPHVVFRCVVEILRAVQNGTEFVNQTLREYYEKIGISHETSVARSLQQNGVVERRNRTLIEAAHTMLIYAKAPLFLWAEAVATTCYTQNRSIIHLQHDKTPYELLHDKPPDLSFFHVFGALCYPTNDSENLGKLQPKADIGIFIGYPPTKKAFRIYNRCTRRIIETIHVDFDELTAMASEHSNLGPALHEITPATISSGLVPNPPPSTPFVPPSRTDWDILFQPMFDELLTPPPSVDLPAPKVIAPIDEVVAPVSAVSTGLPSSTTVDQDAPSPSNSQTIPETQPPIIPNDVEEDNHDIKVAHMGNDLYFGILIPETPSDQSSSSVSIHIIMHPGHQIYEHNSTWTKDHPLENIIGELDRPVSIRLQLHEQNHEYHKRTTEALNDALVPREQRLRIGNCNYRLSTTFTPKEPTFQVALDVLSLTLYAPDLPKSSWPEQPWRTFGTIINKCLSGKATGLDQLRLSRAQIIWDMYNQKKVDYVYLLWEDLVYQIENKVAKKNNDIYYQRFTKGIINHFMSKDQSLPRRNKVDWHMANNDPFLTTMRFIPKHETIQKYDAIIPDTLTNQAMKESEAYKTYHDFATGKVILKPKYVRRSTREKTDQAPTASLGKRLKATSKKSSDEDDDDEVSISKDDDDDAENEDDDGQDDDNEQTESDNDDDDFVHPKFSTHDEKEIQDEELKKKRSSSVSSGFISNMLNLNLDTGIDFILNLNTKLTSLVDVPVTMNVEMPPSSITTLPLPPIPLVQPQSEAQADNEDFINKMDENMKKIIKEQVKVQIKEKVSKILSKIEKFINDQLEAEVLIRSSNKAKTSYAKTLYKALVDAYETDKDILETYGDTVTFKRHRDDEDEDEEPSAGSNRGPRSKRRRAGKEPESTSAPKEKTPKSTGKSKEGSKSHQTSTGKSAQAEEPIHADEDLEEPAHQVFDTLFTEDQHVDKTTQHPDCTLARNEDPRESFNELMGTPLDFSAFVLNRLKVDTLTLKLLAGPTFELMKGLCKSLVKLEQFLEEVCRQVIPFDHFINNDLAYLSGGVSSQTYATSVTKTKAVDYGHIKWIEDLVPNTMESARDVYSRNRINRIKKLTIVKWHNYKHLEWITVCRDDDKMYTFKEGDYNRLCLQDIEDMLLLLVQGKLTNLSVEERLALGVSLRMFTRSIVIRRRVEDLQLGVETYSNPKGFIYQNKDKKNRLMCIDELYKFSDGTLNDVRSALDDILKRIQIKYLP